ncbi:MAG TPA: NADPH-dependent F420 reductase [Limnochordales bacterium]
MSGAGPAFQGRVAVLGGTGAQGWGLALRWAAAGIPVAIGSRDPGRAREAAARLAVALERAGLGAAHPPAGLSNLEAARWADVAVVTVPAAALPSLLPPLADVLRTQTVVDVSVSLALQPDGRLIASPPPEGSTALRVRALLGGHPRLAAAFHTVSATLLAEPHGSLQGDDTAIFADDPESARVASALAGAIGLRPVPAGDLRDAALAEHLAALLIRLGRRHHRRGPGIRFTHLAPG